MMAFDENSMARQWITPGGASIALAVIVAMAGVYWGLDDRIDKMEQSQATIAASLTHISVTQDRIWKHLEKEGK